MPSGQIREIREIVFQSALGLAVPAGGDEVKRTAERDGAVVEVTAFDEDLP
jgi:hypothetical protein